MKFDSLLTNTVIFHNTLDIADIVRELQAEGWKIVPEDLAETSPDLTEHTPCGSASIHPRTRPRPRDVRGAPRRRRSPSPGSRARRDA